MTRRMLVKACVTSAALAVCLGVITSTDVSTASGGRPKALSSVSPLKSFGLGLKAPGPIPLIDRLVRSTRVARGQGAAAAAAAVQTDKRAYLPGSDVVATGSGWSSNVVVTLTYTEIASTDPKDKLNGPVTVFASTDASGSFSSAGDP